MVLQNKYKARASRRYRAAKGIPPKEKRPVEDSEENASGEAKGLPSNQWRYTLPESDEEGEEEQAESEPEVDLTKLKAKVAELDMHSSEDSEEELYDKTNSRKEHCKVLDTVDWDALRREKEQADKIRAVQQRLDHASDARPTITAWRPSAQQESSAPRSKKGSGMSVRYEPKRAAQQSFEVQDIDDFMNSIDNSIHAVPLSSKTGGAHAAEETKASAAEYNPWQDKLDRMLG